MHDNSNEALPDNYRAWRWYENAEPLALRQERVTMQAPAAGQVVIRNTVIGLNPVDWKVLGGGLTDWQPGHVPGVDGAGVVVAVGDGVSGQWLGQRVAYHTSLHVDGSFAEYAAVAARALLRLPDTLDFEAAAGVPCPALTAWLALEKLPAQPNLALLVSGAGGAVGNYLVQLASQRGFSVTAMAHARHWERLLALGARTCIGGTEAAGTALPAQDQFFAVIDCVGERHAERLAGWLRANGHLVCIQGRVPHWPCAPFGQSLSLHEVALGALHNWGDDTDWRRLTAAGERLLGEIAAGRLRAQDSVVSDFDALAHALEGLRRRDFSGKPLVRVGAP